MREFYFSLYAFSCLLVDCMNLEKEKNTFWDAYNHIQPWGQFVLWSATLSHNNPHRLADLSYCVLIWWLGNSLVILAN